MEHGAWNGTNDLYKKNAAVLLCLDIRQLKDFLLFLGGKTSNYIVMKMPSLRVVATSRVGRTARIQRKLQSIAVSSSEKESILKAVQTKKIYHHSPSGSYRIGLSSENINFEDVLHS